MPQFNILHEMYILVNQIVENVFVPINLNNIHPYMQIELSNSLSRNCTA